MAEAEKTAPIKTIEKYLNKVSSEQKLQPNYENIIILSDSQGRYLRNLKDAISEFTDTSKVTFWFKGGRKTNDGVSFLVDKVSEGCPLLSGQKKNHRLCYFGTAQTSMPFITFAV